MSKYNDNFFKLRPHHTLCLNFFRGEGYSQDFVKNMTSIVNALSQNPQIELVNTGDSVCIACPNRIGDGGCETYDKVLSYDNAVLKLCNMHIGQTLTWNDFKSKVQSNILDRGLLKKVCGDCCWFSICSKM